MTINDFFDDSSLIAFRWNLSGFIQMLILSRVQSSAMLILCRVLIAFSFDWKLACVFKDCFDKI